MKTVDTVTRWSGIMLADVTSFAIAGTLFAGALLGLWYRRMQR